MHPPPPLKCTSTAACLDRMSCRLCIFLGHPICWYHDCCTCMPISCVHRVCSRTHLRRSPMLILNLKISLLVCVCITIFSGAFSATCIDQTANVGLSSPPPPSLRLVGCCMERVRDLVSLSSLIPNTHPQLHDGPTPMNLPPILLSGQDNLGLSGLSAHFCSLAPLVFPTLPVLLSPCTWFIHGGCVKMWTIMMMPAKVPPNKKRAVPPNPLGKPQCTTGGGGGWAVNWVSEIWRFNLAAKCPTPNPGVSCWPLVLCMLHASLTRHPPSHCATLCRTVTAHPRGLQGRARAPVLVQSPVRCTWYRYSRLFSIDAFLRGASRTLECTQMHLIVIRCTHCTEAPPPGGVDTCKCVWMDHQSQYSFFF